MITGKRLHLSLGLMVGLLLLAFALRLLRLDYQSLWWDEGISLHLATSGFGEIIRDRLDNIHPPLYFFILKGWLALVGVSPFTGRYLSTLASLTQVALVFVAARHWSGGDSRRSGLPWLAAVLMLLSPLSVIYGQEIRVYAMLPLVYIGALLLAERLMKPAAMATRPLVYLALIEWIGLHLHYIAIFGVAYIAAWGLLVTLRRHDFSSARRWIIAHAVVAMASLPWLLAVLGNWQAVRAEANAGTFMSDPVPLPFLFSQVWAFHLTGLAGSLASEFVRVGAGLAALLTLGLMGFHLLRPQDQKRSHAVRLLTAHWIVPLIPALLVWSVRSFSHPRYIVMFAAMLIPLVTFLIYAPRSWAARFMGVALAVCVVSLSFWGLGRYFFSAESTKPDIRGVASYLESEAGPGDVIFVPDTDWSLPFEYSGEAAVVMPHLSESPHAPGSVLARVLDCTGDEVCAESGRVYVVEYPRGTRDWQSRLPFELERRGYWSNLVPFDGVNLREYRLTERAGPLPVCGSSELVFPVVRFDTLQLESVWVEQDAASDTAVAVALCWRTAGPTSAPLTASLVLRDPVTGERIAQGDVSMLNDAGATTDRWLPGETVITYHLLPLPPGTPPVDMALALTVYRADDATMASLEGFDESNNPSGRLISLGAVSLTSPVGLNPTPYEVAQPPLWDVPIEFSDGVQLVGARFSPGPYRPGQTVRVGLTWRATAESMPDLPLSLRLEQSGVILAENDDPPVNGRYPTDRWLRGETVFEYRDIRVPPGVEGPVQLWVSAGGERTELLGEVTVSGATVLFDRPSPRASADVQFEHGIALIGYDLPSEALAWDHVVSITLYWESSSGEIPTGYTVFVHLLGEDGTLLAQHDSPPANGTRPTDEWLPGEFIIDPHELVWRESGYSGIARIAVGLYDPSTGRRLTTADGFDHFELPLILQVRAAP